MAEFYVKTIDGRVVNYAEISKLFEPDNGGNWTIYWGNEHADVTVQELLRCLEEVDAAQDN
jgi:hypothetical protein